jgi:hypothetical protein
MKDLIKHDNAINLYYLNLLGTVMLRPRNVILVGGDGVGSATPTFDAPPPGCF